MKWFQPLLDLVVKDKLVSERTNDAHQAVRQLLLLSPEGIFSIMAKLEIEKNAICKSDFFLCLMWKSLAEI